MEALLTLARRWNNSGIEMRNYFCQYVSRRNYVFLYAGPMKVSDRNACFIGSYHVLPAYNCRRCTGNCSLVAEQMEVN